MLRNALRKLTKKQNHRLTQAGGSLTNSFIYIKFLCCVTGKKTITFPSPTTQSNDNLLDYATIGLQNSLATRCASFVHTACLKEPLLRLFIAQTQHVLNHARTTIHQLGIRQLHVHHPIALHTSQAYHQRS